jgi:cytochrome c553
MKNWLSKVAALLVVLAASRLRRPSPPSVAAALSIVIRHPWLALGALAAVLAVGGFAVVVSGLVPIKASAGHFAITEMFLQFAKRRSVATHSIGIEVPPLDDRAMVLKGAGHFEGGCRSCHAGPGEPPPRIPQAMTPVAPPLASRIRTWNPAELFYIVKHGIKLTGMPAWPAQQRDDEVWAMVAFLRVLPDLDRAGYLRLVNGDAPATLTTPPIEGVSGPPETEGIEANTGPIPAAVARSCGRCHGIDGRGRENSAFPRLAGQSETYLLSALEAYASGTRHSGIMEPIATGLDERAMREVALYYSRRAAPVGLANDAAGSAKQDPAYARGAGISERGIPAKKVPSCSDCHGPTKTDRNRAYPELAGQFPEYLVLQLQLFARQERGGSEYAHLMPPVAAALTTEEMSAVAQYYASLPR